MDLPPKLYKYQAFSTQSLLNLKNQVIFFGSPLNFNDPYDSALKANIKDLSREDINQLLESLTDQLPANLKNQISILQDAAHEEQCIFLKNSARDACNQQVDKFQRTRGVSCFSETNSELLMWAHYADKFQGFCLEFDTQNNDLFHKAKKVSYVDEIPSLDAINIFGKNTSNDLMELFCTKSSSWVYEKEWRCIHEESNKPYTYSTESLTGVYFGPKMDRSAKDILCLILKGQNPHVKFWEGSRSETRFNVEFKEIVYMPYLEAKQKGLTE